MLRHPAITLMVGLLWVSGALCAEPTWTPQVEVEALDAADDERDGASFATDLDPADTVGQKTGLADVLESAPGVYVRRAGRAETVVLRGAAGHQIAVFLDDIPLTTSRGGAFDFSTMPPVYLERVEVLRGAAAAAYGSGAQGGVVHLHTRSVSAVPGRDVFMRARIGSYDLRQIDAALAEGSGDGDVLLVGSARGATDDFLYTDTNGNPRRRGNNDYLGASGLLRLRHRFGSGDELTMLAEGQSEARGEAGPEQFERDAARSSSDRVLVAARHANETLLDGRLALGTVVHQLRQRFVYVDPDPIQLGQARRAERDDRSTGGRARIGWLGSTWQLPSVAVEAHHEGAQSETDGIFAPPRDESRTRQAVTLSEELFLLDDRVSVLGVARLDDTDDRALLFIPKGGLAVRPIRQLTLQGNVGRAFRDPSFDELYFEGLGIFGNPDLRSEDGLGWDLGLRLDLGGTLSVEVVHFRQTYDRLILFLPVNAFQIRATDDHGARVRGEELALGARLSGLRLDLAYTRLVSEFDARPRSPLPYRPEHRLAGTLGFEVASALLYVAATGRSEVTIDRFGNRTLDGYQLWTVGARGPLWGGLWSGLEVRNVFDVRDATDALQLPLPGRTVLVALEYQSTTSPTPGSREGS